MERTLLEIGKTIHNLSTELQTRALHCLELLFMTNVNEEDQYSSDTMDNCSRILSIWYGWLSVGGGYAASDLTFLLRFCRCPFPDIKLATLKWLQTFLVCPWLPQLLAETAGFVEFLLDRQAEFDKNVLLEKHLIVSRLTSFSDGGGVFDAHTMENLKKYKTEGAFYVSGILDVAVEGSE